MRFRAAAAGLVPAVAVVATLACGDARGERDTPEAAHPPGYVVDSILPPEEAMRRFRVGLARVEHLDGARSRDELVRRFMHAAGRQDSAALRALTLSRAEFAWLVFKESRLSRPPYRQSPDIAWLNLEMASESGLRRLLSRTPGMQFLDYHCPDSVASEGRLRITTGCAVRVHEAGVERDLRLFGRMVSLDGRWKIVAFDGDL